MNLTIPFDQPHSCARYELEINLAEVETGDGVLLALNLEACLALANIFQQLAAEKESSHLHLGYTEENPQGPGWRIVINQSGRL